MTTITVGIADISTKMVDTKFGPKPTYALKGSDGQWYKCGFKKPHAAVGDTVSFDFTEGKYGKDVDMGSFSKTTAAPTEVSAPAAPAAAPRSYGPPVKPFPIPPLHGDRAIIRQNALTNARELFAVYSTLNKKMDWDKDVIAAAVIGLARQFEAYSCGDLDMAAAMAEPTSE